MLIKIKNIADGYHDYNFEVLPSELKLEKDFINTILINVKLDKNKDDIILNVNVKYWRKMICDRCLKAFTQQFTAEYLMTYITDLRKIEENNSINLMYISKEQDIIDLSKDVREYIYLSIPMKNICDENCKGICIKCGTNLNTSTCGCEISNTDPRWNKLINIK